MLPVLSDAQCVHALPKLQSAGVPAKLQSAPHCPVCAKMAMTGMQMPNRQMPNRQMPNRQMPGMAGMKCRCHSSSTPMSCRCGIQPKFAAMILTLVWSPHVATENAAGTASLTQQLVVCPDDPDPHGAALGVACTSTAPLPGITSYLVNAYFLFGTSLAQVQEPTSTIYVADYVAERDAKFCDVHIHLRLGEIYPGQPLPAALSCVPNPDGLYAPASNAPRFRRGGFLCVLLLGPEHFAGLFGDDGGFECFHRLV